MTYINFYMNAGVKIYNSYYYYFPSYSEIKFLEGLKQQPYITRIAYKKIEKSNYKIKKKNSILNKFWKKTFINYFYIMIFFSRILFIYF